MDNHHLTLPARPSPSRWSAATVATALSLGRTWLTSPAMRDLAGALGGPVIEDMDRDLPELLHWSAATLDTRRGKERQSAPPAAFTRAQITALLHAAGPLGLMDTPPPGLARYDITIVLGGTTSANELRTRLAASLAMKGLQLGTIIGLTAERQLTPAERQPAGHHTEADHLTALLTETFSAAAATRLTAGSSTLRHHDTPPEVQIVTARPSRPGQRADTSDAINELTRRMPRRSRQRVLCITSAIYVPYQFFIIAPALLAHGSGHAEIIGTPTATDGEPALLAQRAAQETHASITAIARHLILT